MRPDHDAVLEYVDQRYARPAELGVASASPTRVRFRVWRLEDVPVVVLSELPDNPGASVTNTIETAAELVDAFLRERGHFAATLLEHYPRRRDGETADVDLVTFAGLVRGQGRPWAGPSWRRLQPDELAVLIGSEAASELLTEEGRA